MWFGGWVCVRVCVWGCACVCLLASHTHPPFIIFHFVPSLVSGGQYLARRVTKANHGIWTLSSLPARASKCRIFVFIILLFLFFFFLLWSGPVELEQHIGSYFQSDPRTWLTSCTRTARVLTIAVMATSVSTLVIASTMDWMRSGQCTGWLTFMCVWTASSWEVPRSNCNFWQGGVFSSPMYCYGKKDCPREKDKKEWEKTKKQRRFLNICICDLS